MGENSDNEDVRARGESAGDEPVGPAIELFDHDHRTRSDAKLVAMAAKYNWLPADSRPRVGAKLIETLDKSHNPREVARLAETALTLHQDDRQRESPSSGQAQGQGQRQTVEVHITTDGVESALTDRLSHLDED